MKIRKAKESDWSRVVALIATYPDTLVQDRLPEWRCFLVAEENGSTVGCIALEKYSERMAEIRSLAVEPRCNYEEVASLLVDECVSWAEVLGVRQILSVTEDERLFANRGFGSYFGEKHALFRIVNGYSLTAHELDLIRPGSSDVAINRASSEDESQIRDLIRMYPCQLVQEPSLLPDISSFFVAKKVGALVGCAALDFYSGKLVELRSFAVSPNSQGLGIGSRLIATCLNEAHQQQVYEVLAITSQAAPLFRRFGFSSSHGSVYAMWKVL